VTPVLQMTGIEKRYQSLRPLRLQELTIAAGECVAVSGFDAGSAEVLVNLVTGASLPDAGEVRVLGQVTGEIADGDQWLTWLDRFGIMSPRGVLLEGATIEQNMAMSLTLRIDEIPRDVVVRVAALARACGIEADEQDGGAWLQHVTGEAPAHIRARVHLARAIALEPALLVLEHPGADLTADARAAFAETVAAVTGAGTFATLVITQDDDFATKAAPRALRLQPATGVLKAIKKGGFRCARGYFANTPQATRGPPLTPDFGSPVVPLSSLP
jgi:ABC-type transporter Mla maintaining outer membrane lipid asymmetry ATPase subunit MlaF